MAATRRTLRSIANTSKKLEVDANDLLKNYDDSKHIELTGKTKLINQKIHRYTKISESIGETIEKNEDFDKFSDESYNEEIKYKQFVNKLEFK